jgi:excisionase family DNA binding protein
MNQEGWQYVVRWVEPPRPDALVSIERWKGGQRLRAREVPFTGRVTLAEAAALLEVSRATVYRWVKEGRLKARYRGSRQGILAVMLWDFVRRTGEGGLLSSSPMPTKPGRAESGRGRRPARVFEASVALEGLRSAPGGFQHWVERFEARTVAHGRLAIPGARRGTYAVVKRLDGVLELHPPAARGARLRGAATEAFHQEHLPQLTQSLLSVCIPVSDAARRLALTPARVRQLLAERALFGIKFGGRWRIPAFQLDGDRVLPGIQEVLPALPLGMGLTHLFRWFMTPHPALVTPGRSTLLAPLDYLRRGHPPARVAAVAARPRRQAV